MNKNLGKIQVVIAIVAIAYVLMPDLFIGPIDDAGIAVIATVAEVVLGVMRAISSPETKHIYEDNNGYY